MREVPQPGEDALEHGDVDDLTRAGLFPLEQRQDDAQGRVHAGGDVGDGHARARGSVGIAGGGDDAGLALDEQVIGLDVAVRAVLTVARERAVDETRVQFVQPLPSQAQALRHPGRVVLEEHVAGARELVEDLQALGLLGVHGEALLVAVEPHVAGGQALHRGVPVADQVACAGALDLDDLGSHLRQQAGAERTGQDLLEGHDPHAAQGQPAVGWWWFHEMAP